MPENGTLDPDEYHYDSQEIAARAIENLGRNKEYRRLLERYDKACMQRNFVKITQLGAEIERMKQDEVHRLVVLEDERRKNVGAIARLLEQIDRSEHEKYQDLMSGMCFLLDMLDYTISDINDLLRRNKIGVEMGQFSEVTAVKKTAYELAGGEVGTMPEYQRDEWLQEADRLYGFLLERSAVYRRRVDRIEARRKKDDNNHKERKTK